MKTLSDKRQTKLEDFIQIHKSKYETPRHGIDSDFEISSDSGDDSWDDRTFVYKGTLSKSSTAVRHTRKSTYQKPIYDDENDDMD